MSILRTVRTIYNKQLEIISMLGGEYTPPLNTTLNAIYDVHPTPNTLDGRPVLKYFGLGMAYDRTREESSGVITELGHSSTDCNVFFPVPLLMRKVSIGLTPLEESYYRLRINRVINDEEYILCYLKTFVPSSTGTIYNVTKDAEGFGLDIFTPNSASLRPIPKPLDLKDTNDVGHYVAYSHSLTVNLTHAELVNIKEAIGLLYPDRIAKFGYTLGEIGFFTGEEGTLNNKPEAANVQAGFLKEINVILDDIDLESDTGVRITEEIGSMELNLEGAV